MNVIIYLLLGVMATFLFLIIYFIIFWVAPARGSPAEIFIRAKRKRKPIFILDDGKGWLYTVGEHEGDGWAIDKKGRRIFIAPDSIKYSKGVRMAVGNAFRNITVNPEIMDIINKAVENKVTGSEFKRALAEKEKEIITGVDNEA